MNFPAPRATMLAGALAPLLVAVALADAPLPLPQIIATTGAAEMDTSVFLASLRRDAIAAGIAPAVFATALDRFTPDPEIEVLARAQPEHSRTVGDYVTALVSDERIAAGRTKLAEHADTLARIEHQFGVDRHVVLAIWGIESNFGANCGTRLVTRSLATLALIDNRRAAFWRSELMAALAIMAEGAIPAGGLRGSWAGAMGHTQFMPSTFRRYAVDFDHDGRKDLWGVPDDALASTANYLRASGWSADTPWGFEVLLPDVFDHALAAPDATRPIEQWRGLGVHPVVEHTLSANAGAFELLLSAGAGGPAFLVSANFQAILHYNRSTSYALAVGHLADRLAGRGGFARAWPAGDRPMTREDREDLQRLLLAHGFSAGAVDGVIGTQTRAAVRAWQRARGQVADGYPGSDVLQRLKSEPMP